MYIVCKYLEKKSIETKYSIVFTWIGFFRAWWDHAIVRHFVVQGVGKGRRPILIDGHGRVVGEVGLVHHFKHVVTADLSRQVKCYDKW